MHLCLGFTEVWQEGAAVAYVPLLLLLPPPLAHKNSESVIHPVRLRCLTHLNLKQAHLASSTSGCVIADVSGRVEEKWLVLPLGGLVVTEGRWSLHRRCAN